MSVTMQRRSLEVTYRKGRPVAAYLWLPRNDGDSSARTERHGDLVVDFAADGRPIGVEIVSPARVRRIEIDSLLESLRLDPLGESELLPLESASS